MNAVRIASIAAAFTLAGIAPAQQPQPAQAPAAARPATVASPTLRVQPQAVQSPRLTAAQLEGIARAAEPPKSATAEDRADLDKMVTLLRRGKNDEANSVWIRMAQRHAARDAGGKKWIEVESYSNHILYRAYFEPDGDLKARAAKVRATPLAHEARHVTQQPARPSSQEEISESAALELQKAMDEKSQLESMISNVMKKMHDTSNSIVQNLK